MTFLFRPLSFRRPLATRSAILFSIVTLVLGGCSSSDPLPAAQPSNPLPVCPDTPNCERLSQEYAVAADTLFAAAKTALEDLGPVQLQLQPDSMRASAVYRVALVFKDDVQIAVDSQASGSVLHARSASRVGQSDLGVNRRRMEHLLKRVDEAL